jgi:hypothetical protein
MALGGRIYGVGNDGVKVRLESAITGCQVFESNSATVLSNEA